MEYQFSAEIGDTPITIQTGKVAKQASGAVVVKQGDAIVLVTVVASHDMRPGAGFLPLSVEYQERIYAAGRIPGNYFRREIGRPSERETLTSRLIDRPIRPLFPDGWFYEIQVIATVMSMDPEIDPDVLAMTGTSAALEISDIPFEGPIACVRVGRIDGELKINPSLSEYEKCDINIIVAGSETGIVMVEGGADFANESDMLEAIYFGHEKMQPLIELQKKLKQEAGRPKRNFESEEKDEVLAQKVETFAMPKVENALRIPEKVRRNEALREIKAETAAELGEEYADRGGEISDVLHDMRKVVTRDMVLNRGVRIDNRKLDEIRPITCEVGILPRTHGSALFTRGETQVLGVLTIGSGQDEQRVETLSGEESRPFMLHYNFPPFSVGETKRISGPSRRDIGHGGLSTRAVEKVLPPKEEFDYTVRIVSEVLESNGSSSMGTVCAASLSLMDGGVPIQTPVAGIAMGLMKEGDKVAVLSDILGDEDHYGDMDFKVAGTHDGITALQMDIKIHELSKDIMQQALEQAREGRIFILGKMTETLNKSREEISPYAPKVLSLNINPDKIRDVIGPGGKIIRALQSETNSRIEIDDSGLVKISASMLEEAQSAYDKVMAITADPEIGMVYDGKVMKTTDFGAFVQILPGTEGLVHISQLASYRVKKVTDIVKEGDSLKVKVLEISKDGKIRLSSKAVKEE